MVKLSTIWLGDKFEHDGIVYTKTNHNRGFYKDEHGRQQIKSFKKHTTVKPVDTRRD